MREQHYSNLIALLTEATLIVTQGGAIRALNSAAASVLNGSVQTLQGALLKDIAMSPGEGLEAYLRRCSRTKQPLVGAIEIVSPGGVQAFTARGALLDASSDCRESTILLRLAPRWESNARFKALKEQVEELNQVLAKQVRIEYALREQRRWLEVTLTSIGDAVITTDDDCHVAFMNPVAEAMTGWPLAEVVGKPLTEVFVIINEYTEMPVENPAAKALRDGKIVALANHTLLIAKDGTRIPIEDTAAPIILEDEIKGAILVFHDVSRRRLLEKQLIDRANRLELADRRKNEFLVMLAHELRSPLTPISNAIEVMNLQSKGADTFEQPKAVIARQIRHLKRLIDDMLDVARIIRGSLYIALEPTELTSLVKSACADFKEHFQQSRISFSTSIPRVEVWISADPHRITQVLHNLLTNAAKFTPAGGSTFVSLTVEGQSAILKVSDTGAGIDPSIMPELFQPFTQAKQSLDRKSGGLGLGLSIVKGIVELHSGTVNAASEGVNKGAAVVVRLPLAKIDPVSTSATANTPEVEHNHRIVLIEDDIDAADTLRQLLELLGHEVHTAHSGYEGLKMALGIEPTLIISDIGLPEMDGFAVAQRLRQNTQTAHIALVALSGYGGDEIVKRAKQAGFDRHLTKPIGLDELQQALKLSFGER